MECHRKPDVSGFPWVGEQGGVVGNVGLELDWKECRVWVKSHRRVEGLSSGGVVRQRTAWLGWREGPASEPGWSTAAAPPSCLWTLPASHSSLLSSVRTRGSIFVLTGVFLVVWQERKPRKTHNMDVRSEWAWEQQPEQPL